LFKTPFCMRRAIFALLCLGLSIVPSLAFAKSTSVARPPAGLYRFNGFNAGVGPDKPGGAPGSLTVSHGGKKASKVSFTLGYHGSFTPCITAQPSSGTVLVKVKGTFPITPGRGEDHGSWVVGVKGNGVRGVPATFTVGSQAPVKGTIALYFYDEPPEVATFVMKFAGCDVNSGLFGR
jgi:hypothetical protein